MNQAPAAASSATSASATATTCATIQPVRPTSDSAVGWISTRKKKPFRWKPTPRYTWLSRASAAVARPDTAGAAQR